jgi:hypothetical protein
LSVVAILLTWAYVAATGPMSIPVQQVAVIGIGVMVFVAYVLSFWGGIWLLCIAFREEVTKGVMCLLVPFYCLYYICTRWDETKGAFALSLAPLGLLLALGMATLGIGGVSRLSHAFSEDPPQAEAQALPRRDSNPPRTPGQNDPRAWANRPAMPVGPGPVPGPAFVPGPVPGPAFVPGPAPGPSPTMTLHASPPPAPEPEIPAGADAVTRSLIQLKSSDLGRKKEAVQRLERTTPDGRVDQVVPALLPLLDHDDGFLVSDAIKALAVWQTPEAIPALIARTRDNRFFVRGEAIKALGKYRDARAAEAIAARLKEDGFAAEPALKEMGPVAEPAVIGLLRSPDPDLRRRACEVLKQIGGQEALRAMQALPPDPDLGVRMAAQESGKQIEARVGPPPKPARGNRAGKGPASGRGSRD